MGSGGFSPLKPIAIKSKTLDLPAPLGPLTSMTGAPSGLISTAFKRLIFCAEIRTIRILLFPLSLCFGHCDVGLGDEPTKRCALAFVVADGVGDDGVLLVYDSI